MVTSNSHTLEGKYITIIGGTGFIGRYVTQRLAQAGANIRIAVRDIDSANFLRVAGTVGQVIPIAVDIKKPQSLIPAIEKSHAVVNLVGILYPSGSNTFNAVHKTGAQNVAQAAREAGVERLIHISAIGCHLRSKSKYAKSKALGEQAVLEEFPQATILKPSIVYGAEDKFFNLFASVVRLIPILPLIGGGKTQMQPVSVIDVAEAVYQSIISPDVLGKTYELGGPAVYTFKQIMEFILKATNRSALLVPAPWALATIKASFLQLLPRPLITVDQIKLLKTDNIVSKDALTLADLGIDNPRHVEAEVPLYLDRYARKVKA